MSVKALKMALVLPVTVTMRSGHDPSEMLILAPDWNEKTKYFIKSLKNRCHPLNIIFKFTYCGV